MQVRSSRYYTGAAPRVHARCLAGTAARPSIDVLTEVSRFHTHAPARVAAHHGCHARRAGVCRRTSAAPRSGAAQPAPSSPPHTQVPCAPARRARRGTSVGARRATRRASRPRRDGRVRAAAQWTTGVDRSEHRSHPVVRRGHGDVRACRWRRPRVPAADGWTRPRSLRTAPRGGGCRSLPDSPAPLLWRAGWLVAAASNGDVLCLRAIDGHVVWRSHVTSPVRARPALTADRVYLSLDDGRIVALDLATGAWCGNARSEAHLGLCSRSTIASSPARPTSSSTAWRRRTANGSGGGGWEPASSASRSSTRTSVLRRARQRARALHRWNGSQRWKQGLPLRPSGAPLLVGSTLYVAGVAAELHAYRADTGADAGKFEAPAELASPPQLAREPLDPLDLLSAAVLLTRAGDLLVLRRRIEPAIVPIDHPFGVPVPLVPPPAPTGPSS